MIVALHTTERDGTDPRPLNETGRVSGLRWETQWPGGCWALSCNLDLGPRATPRAALEGRRLYAYIAGCRVWSGLLNEITRGSPWQLKAEGLAVQAKHTEAIVDTGDFSYQVSEHINYAISRGALVGWRTTTSTEVPNLPTGPDYNLTTVENLLNLSMASNGRGWGVDAFGNLTQPAVPTVPSLYVTAPVLPLGRTLDGYATHIAVTYLTASDTTATVVVGTPSTAVTNRFGRVEARVDVSKYGILTLSEAQSVVGGLPGLLGPRASFTGKVPLTKGTVFDAGGVPVHPALITAGTLVRFQGSQPGLTSGEVGKIASIDVQLGSVEYDHDLETAVVAPMQSRARGLADVLGLVVAGERDKAFALAAT